MQIPENTEKDPDDPEPAGKGDQQIDYSLTNDTAKVWEQ